MARRQKIMIASKDTNRLKRIEFKSINCSKYDRFCFQKKTGKNPKENCGPRNVLISCKRGYTRYNMAAAKNKTKIILFDFDSY